MKRYYILAILIFIAAGLGVYGWAQSKSASKERQEYEKLLEQWKPMVAELSQLRYEYFDVKRKPGEDEIVVVEQTPKRQALKKEFDEKFKKPTLRTKNLSTPPFWLTPKIRKTIGILNSFSSTPSDTSCKETCMKTP